MTPVNPDKLQEELIVAGMQLCGDLKLPIHQRHVQTAVARWARTEAAAMSRRLA